MIKMSRMTRRTNWNCRKGNGRRTEREMGRIVCWKFVFKTQRQRLTHALFRALDQIPPYLRQKKIQLISCYRRLSVGFFTVEKIEKQRRNSRGASKQGKVLYIIFHGRRGIPPTFLLAIWSTHSTLKTLFDTSLFLVFPFQFSVSS